ncbi:unnamed protein product [Ectocarpus sp. CCAP 1310/34]|nr:unnamed protein product [Ectocarpus sp. CCAP 1310/34]
MVIRLGGRRGSPCGPAVRLGGSSSAAAAAFGWSIARAALLLVAFGAPACLGVLRRLGSTSDAIVAADIEPGGPCDAGCVRTVVNAEVYAAGEVDCELRVENLLDHTDEDVLGGSLNVVHSCTNAAGDLLYQDQGECLYSVCVTAEWKGELLTYTVVVEHAEPSAAHTVLIEVYMNEYEDLLDRPDVTVVSDSSVLCELGTSCADSSACPSGYSELVITTTDEYGDGWVGGLPDRSNTWTLTDASSSSVVAEGTLHDWHFSGMTKLCLQDGDYSFETTADAAWSSESAWNVCEVDGGMGGSLDFEMSNSACNVLDSSSKDGPPATVAETSLGDFCALPADDPCVDLDVGVAEVRGPSVGMYYDESCLEGGGGDTGCGGGGVTVCRICFVNREFWLADFPDERYPDWLDCPCCVADALVVTCQAGVETGTASDESIVEKAEAFYWEGGTLLCASLGGLIGLGLITALCCCRDIRKTNQLALSYKHFGAAAVTQNNYKEEGDTSPDVSPPSGKDASVTPPAFPADDRERGLQTTAAAAGVETLAAKKKPSRAAPRPTARRERSADARGRAAEPPDDFDGELPGAAAYQPPSDASWPSDPRVGVSVSGTKNPRWSGSRELNAYLRRTGYEEMDTEGGGGGGGGDSGGRGHGGGNAVVQAIKTTGSMLSEKSKSRNSNKFARMEEGAEHDEAGYSLSMQAVETMGTEEIPLGDLPVSPSPPPAAQRSKILSKPRSKSRSRSRSPRKRRGSKLSSHRRGGGGSSGSSGKTNGSGSAPIDGSLGVPWESSSKSSRLSGRGRPSRVAPTDEDSGPDEFGTCDPSLLDRVAGAEPPEPLTRNVPKNVPRSGAEPSEGGRDKSRGRGLDENGGGRSRSRSKAAGLPNAALEGERARPDKASRRQQEEERERKRAERSRALKEEQAEERRRARALKEEEEREKERAERKWAERARALEEERAEESRRAAKALEREQAEERQRRQQERERRRVEEERKRSAERERARSVGSSGRSKGNTAEREPCSSRRDDRHRDKKKKASNNTTAASKQLQPPSYKESGGRERGRQRRAEGPTGARGRSTPAGDGGVPEHRETEAERRRRRSREDKERRQAEAPPPPPPPFQEQEGRRSKKADDRGGKHSEGSGGGTVEPADESSKRRSPSRSRPAAEPAAVAAKTTTSSTRFSNDPRAKKERAERAKERRRAAGNA